MTEETLRARMVQTARSWLSRNDTDGSHRLIIDLYNAYLPLPRGYHLSASEPWCAATISALAIVNGLTHILPVECSCGRMVSALKTLNAWTEKDSFHPRLGDVIFYDWQDPGSPGQDNLGAPDHTGIVEAAQDGFMIIIEGNRKGCVKRRAVAPNGRFIRGYGTPDYAGAAASRSLEELAHLQVLDSPEYWRQHLILKDIPHLGLLLCKASERIRQPGRRCETAEAGLNALAAAGVVNQPEIWSAQSRSIPAVGQLLRALGGAVQAD